MKPLMSEGFCHVYNKKIKRKLVRSPEYEKINALEEIMAHCHNGKKAYFNPAAIERTMVYAPDVFKITGKCKNPKYALVQKI